ncbi:MAG TPA: hypothetical protein EYP85_02900 [Armatimonadetes bacterium]|nr:hypothetical protein [Armatimonadota bacterium]
MRLPRGGEIGLLLLILLLGLAGCGSGEKSLFAETFEGGTAPPLAQERPGTITGIVCVRQLDGKIMIVGGESAPEGTDPLPGVQVQIPSLRAAVQTGDDGRYTFPNIPPGPYQIVFILPAGEPYNSAQATFDLILEPGQTLEGLPLE